MIHYETLLHVTIIRDAGISCIVFFFGLFVLSRAPEKPQPVWLMDNKFTVQNKSIHVSA